VVGPTEQVRWWSLSPVDFTGDVDLLSGRQAAVRARVKMPLAFSRIDRDRLRALVAKRTPTRRKSCYAPSFLRRVALIARGQVTCVWAPGHSAGTLQLQEFLTAQRIAPTRTWTWIVNFHWFPGPASIRFTSASMTSGSLICWGGSLPQEAGRSRNAGCLDSAASMRAPCVISFRSSVRGRPPRRAVYAASRDSNALVLEAYAPGDRLGRAPDRELSPAFPRGSRDTARRGAPS